jgi:hypothetical protein
VQWLRWSRRLQAIAQDGLTYSTDGYDLERYERLRELAAEIFAAHSTGTLEEAFDLLALETGPATPSEILDEVPSAEVDSDGVRFFGEDELPELSITRITPPQVSRYFEHHRNPNSPPDFD